MSLTRIGFIPLPAGAEPGFDHADVYYPRRRMYVAHTGADRVEVLDCEQQTFLHSLSDLPGVVGVLVDEEHHLLFTSDRAAARVSVFGEPGVVCSFDSEQPALLETVETERGAHTTGWDPIDQCLHVFCPGSGGAAVYEERA